MDGDEILYLVHVVPNAEILEKIKKYGALKTSKDFTDQFPGVYFTLMTKRNLGKERLFFPRRYILLFSRKLLQQKNYHFNYLDYNGIITEKTIFPWNLNTLDVSRYLGPKLHGNELVFHDDVSLDFLCQIIDTSASRYTGLNVIQLLPSTPLENDAVPDTTKLPFVLYVDYRIYSGIHLVFYEDVANKAFIRNMAKVAGIHVHGNSNINTILDLIKDRYAYFYKRRRKQNLELMYYSMA
jgi:hypothetical protein